MNDILAIIDKYEIPQEYHEALWEAYQEGSKRGFISGAINVYNKQGQVEA